MNRIDQCWNTPPIGLALSENEVHIWRASLELSISTAENLKRLLAPDEVTRAKRFHFERDRLHFIAARGILRTILSRYLDIDPSQLRFCYNSYGKPSLDPSTNQIGLNFNLSHSRGLALYAFAHSRQVGIDVAYMRSDVEYEELARQNFSPFENAVFHALPEELKRQAFFNCWTRKEAYIKARGRGLSLPLDLFDMSLRPGEPAALLNSREDPQETARWSLLELAPNPGYSGAIAVEGSGWFPSYWQWGRRV